MRFWIGIAQKSTIALAFLGVLICYSISIRSHGMDEGLAIGEHELQEFKTEIGYQERRMIFSHDKGTYEYFFEEYRYLTALFSFHFFLAILLQLKDQYFEREYWKAIWIKLLGCLFTILILLKLRELIFTKSATAIDQSFLDLPRNLFAKATITYDWIVVTVIVSILILQLANFAARLKGARH